MEEAKAFLKRQIDLVSKQVEKVESVVEEKCLIIKGKLRFLLKENLLFLLFHLIQWFSIN